MLKVTKLNLEEVLVLEYDIKEDNRSIFHRTFSKKQLEEAGIKSNFVEEILYNIPKKDTVYGIHFQNYPKAQEKLLYCTKGRGLDFAIDLRHTSKTFKKWVCVELTPESGKQIYIPAGFGHAFLSLEADTQLAMRIDTYFDPALSKSIKYNDPELNINFSVSNPILSNKDKNAPTLNNCNCNL